MSASFVTDAPIPIGIPPAFLDNALANGLPADEVLDSAVSTLLHQYRAARGFAFDWGHVIEDSLATTRQRLLASWRVVPVAVYELHAGVRSPLPPLIPTLLREIRAELPVLLVSRLARGLIVTGCHHQAFLHPHALLSLQLVDAKQELPVRRWLDDTFVPEIAPALIELVRARIVTRAMQPKTRDRDVQLRLAH